MLDIEPMTIAVDFDGTCVDHRYPYVGQDVPDAIEVLHELLEAKCRLILLTMRGDKHLEDAVKWFKAHSVPLFGVNENPEQSSWTSSNKVYANMYIDDSAVGTPLVVYPSFERPCVLWKGDGKVRGIREIIISRSLYQYQYGVLAPVSERSKQLDD
jgi:hypothetical protein